MEWQFVARYPAAEILYFEQFQLQTSNAIDIADIVSTVLIIIDCDIYNLIYSFL